ncbi:MAG TPA: hypothetical protein VML56_03020, partial [Burkholderiales bacterium]|nr:hypothetical protein [Burkholderiales bacterium]
MGTMTARAAAAALSMLGMLVPALHSAADGDLQAQRLATDEIPWPGGSTRVEGTAMRSGLQTVVVAGDAKGNGLYTMMVRLPANTKVPPHSHPDVRS